MSEVYEVDKRCDVTQAARMHERMAYCLNLTKSMGWRLAWASTLLFARADAFRRDAAAATSIEYALLASFIAVTIAGICGMMFSKLSSEYGEITDIFS